MFLFKWYMESESDEPPIDGEDWWVEGWVGFGALAGFVVRWLGDGD